MGNADGTANVSGHLHGLFRDLESSLSIVLKLHVTSCFKMQSQLFLCLHMFVNLVNFARDSSKRLHIFEHLQDARCQMVKAFLSHKRGAA